MLAANTSVPVSVEVSVSEVMRGIFEIEGVLSYADQTLTIAYHTKGVKWKKSAEETFHLPLDALRDVELKGRMWDAKIVLHPKQLTTLEQVPWASADAVVLKIKRAHREQAEVLVAHLQRALSERGADDTRRIPFQLPSANLGFTEIKGLLYLDDEFLVFEVGTGVTGGSKKKRQTIKIEPRALEAIRLEQSAFGDRLCIRPKERDLFRVMPGMYKSKEELTLTIKKRYRKDAEHLVDEIRRLRTK